MKLKLSIIVPMFNVEQYIERCLNSLLHQNLPMDSYEIIVIDDGSTDGGGAIIESFAKTYPNIKYYYQTNRGIAATRNVGLDKVNGQYCVFVDSDDFVRPDIYPQLLAIMEKEDLDIMICDSCSGSADTFPDVESSEYASTEKCSGDMYLGKYGYANYCWLSMYRVSFLKSSNIRFIEGHNLEDTLFVTQTLMMAKSVMHVSIPMYYYYMRENSIMHKKDILHMQKLIQDYHFNIQKLNQILRDNKQRMSVKCYQTIEGRRNSFLFFMLVKMLRSKMAIPEVMKIIKDLEKDGLYPFPEPENKSLIYLLIHKIITQRFVYLSLLKLNHLLK